ncbi:hypothetical protein N7491_007671 [Penicillium cf. griseofulvum]|uniref:Uncharacterized protein n=1 Tax=Penicillium cf. griseofulvum TaxID=2972120 RepID=A0A9W9M0U0_9EURO|nr:hypothetical protein N7472_009304 [Penicillium cf. griseofulvum]KAJ5430655.1 hypothetical protein N7491_007671 [Penicillium cf. griseofulvum]KAJ5435577.1 hypothetical protein N7445_006462 [Penicillium cf. griseofulvum]
MTNDNRVGNEGAAQDLYGLGVRIGLYLQALGLILSSHGGGKERGKGLKVASGAITVSILGSWFVYAARTQFSPSEAIIVLLILTSLLAPATSTLLIPRTIVGEIPGLVALMIADLGISAAFVWTFAQLVSTLPLLNTTNLVFFFAPVALNGWFRYLALAISIVDAIFSLRLMYKLLLIMRIAWGCYVDGRTEATADELDRIKKTLRWEQATMPIMLLPWATWALVIVAVEITLRWNHLSPSTDLQSSGQLIPLTTGIIVLIDSVAIVLRRLPSIVIAN